jgi:hypothetical protein
MENKAIIYSNQATIAGHRDIIGFGNSEFRVTFIPLELSNRLIIENHYSKTVCNNSYIHLGVYGGTELLGVLQFGYALNPASGKIIVPDTKNDEYLELNRMWLHDNLPRNSESMAISYAIKIIRSKYRKIRFIQSFADERCGRLGVVYQACNFGYYGCHKSSFWILDNVVYHDIAATAKREKGGTKGSFLQANLERAERLTFNQYRYLYFMIQRFEKECLHKRQPYPKHKDI